MKLWNNMSMRMKLLMSFFVILLVFSSVSLYHLNQVQRIGEQIAFQNHQMDKKILAMELKQKVQELDVLTSGLMISKNLKLIEEYGRNREIFKEYVNKIGENAATADQRKWRAMLNLVSGEYTNNFDMVAEKLQDPELKPDQVNKSMEIMYNLSQAHKKRIFELIDQFNNVYSEELQAAVSQSNQILERSPTVSAISIAVVLVMTILIAVLLIRSYLIPIRKLQQAVQLISQGDLRHKIGASSKDELGQLSRHFDEMIDSVKAMLGSTQYVASSLNQYSMSFHGFTRTTADANADVLRALDEISKGANQQAEQSEQSALLISDLEKEMAEVTRSTEIMRHTTDAANRNTKTGFDSVAALKEAADRSEAMLDKMYQSLETLASHTNRIGQITNTITEIANQTNLLSLNAAIEAARAGVDGKGFSVIADEVRRLSFQSKDSSEHIAEIIKSLQQQMREAQGWMLRTKDTMSTQSAKMSETLEAFRAIESSMFLIVEQTEQIHRKVDQTHEKNHALVISLQQVAAIAEETAASIQEVTSTSYQQNEAIRLLTAQADEINNLSLQLFNEVNKFRVELDSMSSDDDLTGTESAASDHPEIVDQATDAARMQKK